MMLDELRTRIRSREATVGVVGLGYVGLPVACTIAEAGFNVIGIDRDDHRVAIVARGESPIGGREPGLSQLLEHVVAAGRLRATSDSAAASQADVVLICVDTPVDADHVARFGALRGACSALGAVLKDGALVIVESTLAPGTVDKVVRPALEASSGRRAGLGFHLGHCPERVMPGRMLTNLRTMRRICGGETLEVAAVMVGFYRCFIDAELDATDCLTAELVKTTENTFRDVNIAFANEVALVCEAVGGDVWKVRELVNKAPERLMHVPGAGVGGHCIPKDPWLLIANAGDIDAKLIRSARAVNDGMPAHIAEIIDGMLRAAGRAVSGSAVAVLGYSYLANSDDTRSSPSSALAATLRQLGADVRVHDPFVEEYAADVTEALRSADCIVLMVAHDEYGRLDWAAIRGIVRTPLVVDGRAMLDGGRLEGLGFRYRRIGTAST